MAVVPTLAEGDPSSAISQWDVMRDTVNRAVAGGQAIIELALTPAGDVANEVRLSTVHSAPMLWNGTHWTFLGGPPDYYVTASDLVTGFSAVTNVAGTTWATGTAIDSGFRTVATIATATTCAFANRAPSGGADATHPGQLMLRTDTVGAANAGCALVTGNQSFPGSDASLRGRAVFSIQATTATFTHRIGFIDTTSSVDATQGAYIEINGATMSFKTANGGTRTTNATTATLTASTWYTVHFIMTSSSACRCVVMKDDGTVVYDQTNSSNLWVSGNTTGFGAVATNSASAASTNLLAVDYLGVGHI